jgi:hypothetical protein
LLIATAAFFPVHGQNVIEDSIMLPPSENQIIYTEFYPNPTGKGMMTPTGWGGASPYIFGYIGGTFPQVYTNKSDMIAAAGLSMGNAYKNVNVTGIFNVLNVSEFNTFSGSLIISRYLGRGTSMSVGGLNLLAGNRSDAGASYYVAISHASQKIKSKIPGYSGLSYTIGAGSGRFYDKSRKDSLAGRGSHGTAVFGNISYEVTKGLNVIAEWSGLNLGFAFSFRPSFKLPAINFGLADLTRNSGDRIRFIASISHAIPLSKN